MNIIQELTEKYSGKYSEDLTKGINSPIGKYVYQPKKGLLEIDGTEISININEVSGAMPVAEPIRITLYLDKKYETELTISPKNLWNDFLDIIQPKARNFIPKPIRKQFWFDGNVNLIKQLTSDPTFVERIMNEKIYIDTQDIPTNHIVLTPEYGIKDINQFEKYLSVLRQIENEIKTAHNNGYEQ
jgi:hypothetical protein